jgi:signal transduction histidine kinase
MLPDFRVRQRDYLLEISRAMTQELDLEKLLARILRISMEMLAGQAGLIAMRLEDGRWHVKVSHGLTPVFLRYVEKMLVDVSSNTDDPEKFELPEVNYLLRELTKVASLGLLTGVGLPLVARNQVVGVTFIFRSYPGVFSSNDRALLSSFADQAAIAVQNALLYTEVVQEKHRTDALIDAVADGIFILSNDHVIERCNQALVRMLGMPQEEILNHPHEEIILWHTPPEGMTLEKAVEGGWPLTQHAFLYVEGDLTIQGQQPYLPVGITYAPLYSEEGSLLNIIADVRDITRFRQADELKSTFISIISHELKTPVALIKGYVGTLRRKDATWDREIVEDSLRVIEEETDRLTALIENLLDASRLQAGGLSLKRSDILLSDVAKRIAERFQTQTDKHTILVDFPENFPVILADEIRIEQVFSNLISNAIKYSPQGEIRIRGQVRRENIIVCVTDQGPGIATNDIPFIFDRFYRAPDAARQTKGAGLGLYLTRAIIEAHNGRIWVDPTNGGGGRICFSLPRQVDES